MIVINVDATSLRSSGCTLEWWRKVVKGYRSPKLSSDIIYGVAVHKFIDTMYKTRGDMGKARDEAYKSFRIPKFDKPKKMHMSDERHMLATCVDYWHNYLENDDTFKLLELPNGEPASEMTFRFLYRDDGEVQVWLCGTMDKLGKIKNGVYAIGDYKTTSSWDKDSYFEQYELSVQLRFYIYALKWMAQHYPDSILGKIGASNVGAFIDALFINTKVVENKYVRSDVFQYKPNDMAEFEQILNAKIDAIVQAAKSEARPLKEGIVSGLCERKFGKCDFWTVCKNPDNVAEVLLKRDFIIKEYHPLHFND